MEDIANGQDDSFVQDGLGVWLSNKKLQELEHKLNEVLWEKICAQENNPKALDNSREAQPETKSKL